MPPGFSSGMEFERKKLGSLMTGMADPTHLNLAHILATADDIDLLQDDTHADINNQEGAETEERKELLQEEQVKECLSEERKELLQEEQVKECLSEERKELLQEEQVKECLSEERKELLQEEQVKECLSEERK